MTIINTQASRVHTTQKGTAIKIHFPKETLAPIYLQEKRDIKDEREMTIDEKEESTISNCETAKTFCKLEMGVIMPPKLHA
jgi:hypothetical protein